MAKKELKKFTASTYENKGAEFEKYVRNLIEIHGDEQSKMHLFYADSGLEFLGSTVLYIIGGKQIREEDVIATYKRDNFVGKDEEKTVVFQCKNYEKEVNVDNVEHDVDYQFGASKVMKRLEDLIVVEYEDAEEKALRELGRFEIDTVPANKFDITYKVPTDFNKIQDIGNNKVVFYNNSTNTIELGGLLYVRKNIPLSPDINMFISLIKEKTLTKKRADEIVNNLKTVETLSKIDNYVYLSSKGTEPRAFLYLENVEGVSWTIDKYKELLKNKEFKDALKPVEIKENFEPVIDHTAKKMISEVLYTNEKFKREGKNRGWYMDSADKFLGF